MCQEGRKNYRDFPFYKPDRRDSSSPCRVWDSVPTLEQTGKTDSHKHDDKRQNSIMLSAVCCTGYDGKAESIFLGILVNILTGTDYDIFILKFCDLHFRRSIFLFHVGFIFQIIVHLPVLLLQAHHKRFVFYRFHLYRRGTL